MFCATTTSSWGLFSRYFMGDGIFTWLLAPFNLLVDLLCYKNQGVWKLDQFPEDYQREVNEVLDVFKARKDEIIADIDANFGTGRRGMYVYQWYGKHKIDNVAEFNKDFKYIKTIAVSVLGGVNQPPGTLGRCGSACGSSTI